MSKRRNQVRRKPINSYGKWEEEVICVASKVLRFEVQNQEINEKLKTVFYCESKTQPEGRMCVIWGRTTFKAGDEITMTGRLKNKVFLVWKYFYKSNEPKETKV